MGPNKIASALTVAATFVLAGYSSAAFLNGNFEDTTGWGTAGDATGTQPADWRDVINSRRNAATQQTGANAIGGSGTSAYMPAFIASDPNRREIRQNVNLGSTWRVTFDFASEDPGAAGNRSLSGSIFRTGDAIAVAFRVVDDGANGTGDLQLLNVSSWTTVLSNAIVFDTDVTTTPLVHSIQFEADWTQATAAGRALTVTVLDSNGTTHTAAGLQYWGNATAPAQNNTAKDLTFNTFSSDGDYLLDNVRTSPIPEPASLAVLGLAGALFGMRRRHH